MLQAGTQVSWQLEASSLTEGDLVDDEHTQRPVEEHSAQQRIHKSHTIVQFIQLGLSEVQQANSSRPVDVPDSHTNSSQPVDALDAGDDDGKLNGDDLNKDQDLLPSKMRHRNTKTVTEDWFREYPHQGNDGLNDEKGLQKGGVLRSGTSHAVALPMFLALVLVH